MEFRDSLGLTWDPLWTPFCDFYVICGSQLGDSFRVHVFSDPGMETMPECGPSMRYTQ